MMDEKRSLSEIIESVERPAYYAILILYFFVTLITEVGAFELAWLDGLQAILLPAVLIVVFRYFDRLTRAPKEFRAYENELGAALISVIGDKQSVDEIDLYACTTAKYYVVLRETGIHVDKLRIFMPSESAFRSAGIFRFEVREALVHERARARQNWLDLQRSGKIKEIEFVDLPFVSLFHVVLVDQHSGVFGLFEPSSTGDSFHTMSSLVVNTGQQAGSVLLRDFRKFLSAVQKEQPKAN